MDKSIYSKNYQVSLSLLKQARIDAGLTQTELATKLNETQTFVSKCERSERRLDIAEMREFCIALGLSFQSFVEDMEKELRKSK